MRGWNGEEILGYGKKQYFLISDDDDDDDVWTQTKRMDNGLVVANIFSFLLLPCL